MSADFLTTHPGRSFAAGSGWRRNSVPASIGHGRGREDSGGGIFPWSADRKAQKNAHKDKFHRELTDAVTSKVADFIDDIHESDQEQTSEIMKLKDSVEKLKRMLDDQIHHRVGIERRLDERCDKLDIGMASLKSYDPMQAITMLRDRIDALENGVGSTFDRTTREVEVLQNNYKGLRIEMDAAKETVQSYATAVEVIQHSLGDVASRVEGINTFKDEAGETHKKFVARLEGSLNDAFAKLHGSIVAADQSHAAFRDETQRRLGCMQEHLDGPVKEALRVAEARLGQTNTRLDSCERQCAELAGRSSSLADRAGRIEENLEGVADRGLAVEGLRDAIQNLQSHVEAQQDSLGRVESLQKSVKDCQMHCEKLEEHCVSLIETTCALRGQLDSGESSSEDLKIVKAHVKDLYSILDAYQAGLKDLIADEAREREINHGAVHDRMDALYRKHNDLESLAQEFGPHADRIDGALHSLTHQVAKELKSSRDDVEQVYGVMLKVQNAWGMKSKCWQNKKQLDNQHQPLYLLPAGLLTP